MYLVYTDETGTNFNEKSPYLLYGGLVVHESKIDVIEFQLEQIIAKFLHLNDIRKVELHTHEIFSILFYKNIECKKKRKRRDRERCNRLKEMLRNVTLDDFINFTNEVIQFFAKMNIPLIDNSLTFAYHANNIILGKIENNDIVISKSMLSDSFKKICKDL